MFVECLALELAGSKVRINAVAVNALNTNFRAGKETGITDFENKLFLEHVAELKPLKTEQKVSIKFILPKDTYCYISYLIPRTLLMLSPGLLQANHPLLLVRYCT